jgi:branched chain amino acid efflux pump
MIAQNGDKSAIFAIASPNLSRNVSLVSATTSSSSVGATMVASEPLPERRQIIRAVVGIGVYAGAFGVTFGAVAVTAGLSVIQAVAMSLVMFTGASQFALVGILAAGGAPLAGLSAALLLGLRNAFYGVPVTQIVRPTGWRRLWTAHFVIDETTAMAVGQPTRRAGRYAFWATGVTLYALWTSGTLAGALLGSGIDTSALGLDAAAPAIFLALLWPQLSQDRARTVAIAAIVVTLGLGPVAPAGVPIVAAAGAAIAAGALPARPRRKRDER